jgi:tRNA A37 N6-isopentenylltransferase MiaA
VSFSSRIAATRQLAKRQLTWLRCGPMRLNWIVWLKMSKRGAGAG